MTPVPDRLASALEDRYHIERELAGVETVPDGIHELVMKQQDVWGYIKVMH